MLGCFVLFYFVYLVPEIGGGTAADVAAASEAVSCSLGLDDNLTGRLHQRCSIRCEVCGCRVLEA